jgi:hypothetical protein
VTYDPSDNARKCYDEAIYALRVRKELLLAAKEAAVMLAEFAKAANVDPRGPGFNRLMKAIKDYEAANAD